MYFLRSVNVLYLRHSIWRFLVGLSYDRSLRVHVALGYLAVLATLIHGVWMAVAYSMSPLGWSYLFNWNGAAFPIIPGTLAGIILIVMVIFTIPCIRRRNYPVFKVSHLLVFGSIVLGCIHFPDMLFYLAIPAALYVIDLIVGMIDMFARPARLIEVACTDSLVRLHIRKRFFNCKAGQFCYLFVPSLSLLPHPFSVASPPKDDGSFHLCVKAMGKGRFVDRLIRRVQKSPSTLIFVTGPYGVTRVDTKAYLHVIMVAGGVGITPFSSEWVALSGLARAQEMIPLHSQQALRDSQSVQLVWSFRDLEIPELMLPIFGSTLWPASFSARFYETPKGAISPESQALEEEYQQLADAGGAKLEWKRGQRPNLLDICRATKELAIESGNQYVAILCCGPAQMVSEARSAAYSVSDSSCTFHVHTERFAF